MSSKIKGLINIALVLLSWFSLSFLGKSKIKRFLPASFLIFLLEAMNVYVGKKRKWWSYYNKPNSFLTVEFSMTIGPFLTGSMWLLNWFYGNFKQFIFINGLVNAFFAFFLVKLTEKLKVAKLKRLNNFQFFLYLFYKAPLLYGFQYLFDNKRKILYQLRKVFFFS
jgi:hypothetical protein